MILNDLRKALQLTAELKELLLSLEDVETYLKSESQIEQLESDIIEQLQWREDAMLASWTTEATDDTICLSNRERTGQAAN